MKGLRKEHGSKWKFLGTWNKSPPSNFFFKNNGKNRFYLETIAIGEKRPQYKIGLNSEYSMDKWGFIAGAG